MKKAPPVTRATREDIVRRTHLIVAALAAAVLALAPASARAQNEKLDISAFAINMSNIATGTNAVVQINVDSWSSAEEREMLITTMVEKKQDDLLKALQKLSRKGTFRIPTARPPDPHHLSLGLPIRYAWQTPLPDGGRRIVLAYDRYIGFAEARNQPRSIDYPFTLMEIRVDKDGKGQGKMAVATKIDFDKEKKVVQIENYGSEPVRLNEVRVKVKN
jgi:hypothetical protein